ncbi:MAG: hypothetical protein JWO54_584 [Candidatus Saccharibacteria bacterium]|nr:hypothetical protein [Candidatus Saccharibacteria bacterium]MDB5180755.1 hypothetical protein [Candidatus Saccharibacteria bacterium]MDB5180824.1 hypothetical protein [Candidatus Saccharibacteria bacterium]
MVFYITGKETMSTALIALRLPLQKKIAEKPKQLTPAQKLIESYKQAILRDFSVARTHQIHGKYELFVTPVSPVMRMDKKSCVKADITGYDCETARLLKQLYRELCPDDAEVVANVDDKKPTVRYDQKKHIYLLHVYFTFN